MAQTAAEKAAAKAKRIADAANEAGLETGSELVEDTVDTDDREGLVPDESQIPELQKPRELTQRDFDMALELGLPPLPKRYTQKYLDLRTTYVRFIKQNPEKWDVTTDNGKSLLKDLKALEVK